MNENRFAIKGAGMLGAMAYMEERGWLDDALYVLEPGERRMFENEVLPALWYPLEPYQELLEALGETDASRSPDALFEIGRRVVDNSLNGIYRAFKRSGSVEWLLRKSPILWSLFFRGTDLDIVESGDGYGVARTKGDAPTTRRFCETVRGGIHEALSIGGALDINTTHRQCRGLGHSECIFRATWRA